MEGGHPKVSELTLNCMTMMLKNVQNYKDRALKSLGDSQENTFKDLRLRLLISNSLVADRFQSVHAAPEDLG